MRVRHGLSQPQMRRKPWHARAETRLAAVLIATLAFAGAAATAARQNDDEPQPSRVTIAPQRLMPAAFATATPAATAAPTPPPPTPSPMLLDLRPGEVGLGETMLVWVHAPGAFSVTLEIRGGVYSLLPEADVFWGVVGIPLDAPAGTESLTVTARSSTGKLLDSISRAYELVAIGRPVDRLTLTAEEASVLTPEAAARERELRAQFFSEFDRGRRWTTFFRRPAEGVATTQFGQGRSYNGGPVGSFHTGLDLAAAAGTPVVAPAPARVDWVGEMPIRGISVILDHGAGVKSSYHHLQSVAVAEDDDVRSGQQIGAVGETGLATGPHLHWELTVWGVNVDPASWTLKDFTP